MDPGFRPTAASGHGGAGAAMGSLTTYHSSLGSHAGQECGTRIRGVHRKG
jgi:hypothetical protein